MRLNPAVQAQVDATAYRDSLVEKYIREGMQPKDAIKRADVALAEQAAIRNASIQAAKEKRLNARMGRR